ncbi:MAG: hypothetical protein ACKVYV_03865, partial [Limisphaerales bacterium]
HSIRDPMITRFIGYGERALTVIRAIRYGVVFALLNVLLPFTVIEGFPLHGLLGGLFMNLTFWDSVFLGGGVAAVSLSLLWVEGIVIQDLRGCLNSRTGLELIRPEDRRWFNHEASPAQLGLYAALGLPALLAAAWFGQPGMRPSSGAAAGFGLGWLATLALFLAAMVPAVVAARKTGPDRQVRPIRGIRWLARAADKLADNPAFRGVCAGLLDLFARAARLLARWPWIEKTGVLRFDVLGKEQAVKAQPLKWRDRVEVHFFAVSMTVLLGGVAVLAATVFQPGGGLASKAPTAAAYLYSALAAGIWLFGFLELHLRRANLSPLLLFLIAALLGYRWLERDHYFDGRLLGAASEIPDRCGITPAQAAGSPGAETNLIVVAASGGGILAAGWTTAGLEELVRHRPESLGELKLISGVSGSAVGAAHLVEALRRARPGDPSAAASLAFTNAVTSSLADVTYGLVFLDLPRLASGGLLSQVLGEDRGWQLEAAWRRHAGGGAYATPSLFDLNADVLKGRIPALIFNATAVESGHRVMLTGVTFPAVADAARAPTLGEYAFPAGPLVGRQVDLDLWTAARMSATFPWATPAAALHLTNVGGVITNPTAGHHFADGGYHDNFGVASALDWLDAVLRARETNAMATPFRRVAIVQLRAFPTAAMADPVSGGSAALAGPAITLANIRGIAASERNRIAVDRFVREWNCRLTNQVEVASYEFERDCDDGPLSWHLTAGQKEEIRARWATNATLRCEMDCLVDFLEGRGRPPCQDQKPASP